MAPEQSLAASLHALWLRYETNEAGLHDLGHFLRVHYETIIRSLARPEGANVPGGWKLVPLLPTEAMIQAGYEACRTPYEMSGDRGRAQVCYTDMVIAAPACVPQERSE